MNDYFSNSLYAEQAVLGCLLQDNTLLDETSGHIKVDDFSSAFHRDVYRVICHFLAEDKKADIICVSDYLRQEKNEQDDITLAKVCEIAQSCYSIANLRYYLDMMKQNSTDRKMITAAQDIIASVNQKKENRLDYALQRISEINDNSTNSTTLASDILKEVLQIINDRQHNKNGVTGINTGFIDLDSLTHGLHGGDLIILAGRPGMGKTLFAMNIAEHIALNEKMPVSIFSLEMRKQQLIERSLISVSRIEANRVQSGELSSGDFTKISSLVPHFHSSKLFIDDRVSLSISDIHSECRRIKREHGLSLVVIDYITLMSSEGENETIRIGNISRGLKLLARNLNVPVIAISQLNRAVEQRNEKRPNMADLRQSGAIEQDADLIMFIYRDELYNKTPHNKGLAEIIIAKHRNGNTGSINLAFNGKCCRFDNCTLPQANEQKPANKWHGHAYVY